LRWEDGKRKREGCKEGKRKRGKRGKEKKKMEKKKMNC